MRVLIITDESFATREQALLARLEIGLADEGLRIIHAVPKAVPTPPPEEMYSQSLTYESRGIVLGKRLRARRLVRAIEELRPNEERPIDLVHIFGEGAWPVGLEVAGLTGAAAALEVFDLAQVPAAARARTSGPDASVPVCIVPDPAIERALRREAAGLSVRLAPWGVHTPAQPLPILQPGRTIGVMVACTGRSASALAAAVEGLADVVRRHRDTMIFVDADAAKRANLWPTVRRLNLLDRLTLIPEMEARRDLALRGDVLVLPEALGEHKSITLDAMAAGMLVVAAADPAVGSLIEARTARLVDRPSAAAWAAAVEPLLDNPDAARRLAESARDYVREHHRASAYVAAVVDAYEWITSAEAIPFGDGQA